MNTLENLDYASKITLKAHPDYDLASIYSKMALEGLHPNYFTRQGGARDRFCEVTEGDFTLELIKQAVKVGTLYANSFNENRDFANTIPEGQTCKLITDIIYSENKNIITYLETHPEIKSKLASSFAQIRYGKFEYLLDIISHISTNRADSIVNRQYEATRGIKDINIRQSTVANAREDILNGSQLKNSRNEYSLGTNLFAVSDVGRKRENQEDAVLILTHPKNKDFKLIVVSDGMGGHNMGEVASQFTIVNIMKWFENIDPNYFYYEDQLSTEFEKAVYNTSVSLYNQYGNFNCGATFTGALVGQNKTVIANIGDSRAYTVTGGEVYQVTEDQSVVQQLYNKGEIRNRDDMRFHSKSNVISCCMGMSDPVYPDMEVIPNNYEMLMLFSDGVTDCLSDKQIKILANTSSRDETATNIVNMAKMYTTTKTIYEDGQYVSKTIEGGKDNLSAAVYAPGR